MSSDNNENPVISVQNLSKVYRVWENPFDRIKSPLTRTVADLLPDRCGLSAKLQRKAKRYYRDFYALNEVSFDVRRGESIGIIGRNGSGKSTLLQIIAGTLASTQGEVNVNGRVAALLELGSGFNPEFTGRENVYMNASILGISRKVIDERFSDIEKFADIGDFMDQPVKTYSSGMYVRLAFAVIVHVDADILIVDEALAVGDVFFVQKCMRFLRDFQKRGVLIFVSHDLSAINNLCERAIWLRDGKVEMIAQPKDVTEAYFGAFYLRKEESEESPKKLEEVTKKEEEEEETGETPRRQICGVEAHDQRLDFLRHTNLRNEIQVSPFNPMGTSFGDFRGRVVDVSFRDKKSRTLSWIVGGETIDLEITVQAEGLLKDVIVGFGVKDKLGQVLFGENTFLSFYGQDMDLATGEKMKVSFRFQMPILSPGKYTISATLATGVQTDHEMQHWLHDAIAFESITKSKTTGLVGIPMQDVAVEKDGEWKRFSEEYLRATASVERISP